MKEKMKIEIETKNNLQDKKQETKVKQLIREMVVGLNSMGLRVTSFTTPQYKEVRNAKKGVRRG